MRVKGNKGKASVDALDIKQTARHLVTAWPTIRDQLQRGRTGPVRRDGGRSPNRAEASASWASRHTS
jgi:hypothetical protein